GPTPRSTTAQLSARRAAPLSSNFSSWTGPFVNQRQSPPLPSVAADDIRCPRILSGTEAPPTRRELSLLRGHKSRVSRGLALGNEPARGRRCASCCLRTKPTSPSLWWTCCAVLATKWW